MIGIAYLDGHRLSRSVIAGAHFVAERAEALNKINVFPVPDGDTGTNVASTLVGVLPLWLAVVCHEGSTLLVIANGVRLLGIDHPEFDLR